MSREEIMKLLQIAIAAYPNTKNIDAKAMVAVWEMAFGEESAERVYKAMRFHINTSRFFPTVADIRSVMIRAEIVYNASESPVMRLQGKTDEITLPAERGIADEEIEELCKFVGIGYPEQTE